MYYNCKNLTQEILEISKPLNQAIISKTIQLEKLLTQTSKKTNFDSQIIFTGSTNPNRLTAILDKTKLDSYPIDFDIALVSKFYNDKEKIQEFTEKIPFKTTLKRKFGKYNIDFQLNNFEISIAVINQNENHDPIIYTENFPQISNKERLEIQKFKLISMRSGIYGGFHQGLKGISIEQAILKFTDLVNTFENFEKHNFNQDSLKILHPNGKNLLKTISANMYRKLKLISSDYSKENIKKQHFSEEDFFESGIYSKKISFNRKGNPFEVYNQINKLISRVDKNIPNEIIIIPNLNSNNIYLSINSNQNKINNIQRRLNLK